MLDIWSMQNGLSLLGHLTYQQHQQWFVRPYQFVEFAKYMRLAIKIWILILKVNQELALKYYLQLN